MYWTPRQVQALWGARSIYITENSCAASDAVAADGQVYDSDRVMFLRACLTQLQRATAHGVPVDGNFHWSAQDNFEWTAGYGNHFPCWSWTNEPASNSPGRLATQRPGPRLADQHQCPALTARHAVDQPRQRLLLRR
jgi:hypothetical protein